MRKSKIALAIMAAAALTAVVLGMRLDQTVIVLKDGSVIPVDGLWDSGNDLVYENAKEIRFVNRADIRSVEKRDLTYHLRVLEAEALRWTEWAGAGIGAALGRGAARAARIEPSLVLPAAAALGIGAWLISRRRARRRRDEWNSPPTPPAPREPDLELPNRVDVVRFFLNLFRTQIGAAVNAPADYSQLPASATGPNMVYELRVRHCGDWVKRRMTIGPLGEDSGSRSKCYWVIFDKHFVVKIPPRPVVDFEEYVSSITKEGGIVAQLAPRECIVPKVSVILSQIHQPPFDVEAPADRLEAHYVALLQKNPQWQEHLKIRGTFAYFMDLSRYYFLSHIVDGLHDLSGPMRAEIASTAELVRFPGKIKERYVEMDEAVGFAMRDLFHQCEAEILRVLRRHPGSDTVGAYRIQTWFLNQLENGDPGQLGGEIPPEVAASVRSVLQGLFDRHRGSVEAYLEAVGSFTRGLVLEQNKVITSGILTHLLDLLGWLAEREVAMRDLKPDNILVAGDPHHYPAFLRSVADYSLGFIDVETAADLSRTGGRKITQPLLGGTPYFATPAHLFSNAALEACFGDAARVLHFQDWQAVLVMVYKVVTGELMFDRTAKLFVDIKSRIICAMKRAECLDGHIEEISREFWRSAAEEFRTKVRAREALLRRVEVKIPASAKSLFLKVLTEEARAMTQAVEELVNSQCVFPAATARARLLKTSSRRICQIVEEIDSTASGKPALSGGPLLRLLAGRKALLERKVALADVLRRKNAQLSAYDLLLLMFNSVLRSMVREDWLLSGEEGGGGACRPDDDLSLATTI